MNLEVMKHFLKARNFQRISDTADEYRFTIYRTLKTSRVQLQKFSKSTNSKVCIRMKFTFVLAPCQIDEHSGHIITRMDVSYYEWESSLQSNYSVRNAALIHKAIRLLSLGCTEVADHELMIIFVLPFFTNLPFAYRSPAAVKDNSFVTNIYFDEFLAVFIINNTLTLSGFRLSPIPLIERKPEDPSMYSKYAGSISGLAKIPDLVNNYYQLNQLDLSVIPQDIIKYRLITSGHSKDNPITKMTNVQSLQYYLRREILGLGTCDIKVEIYLSHDEAFSWISALDPKSIFGSLCGYLCSKIIMKKWVIYRRPFMYFAAHGGQTTRFYLNDYLLSQDKPTPKIQPFLRVQAMDFELIYHRVHRYQNCYMIVSIIRKPKDGSFGIKFYVQKNCRIYSTHFKLTDVKVLIEEFLFSLVKYMLFTSSSELSEDMNGILSSISRHSKKVATSLESLTEVDLQEEFRYMDPPRHSPSNRFRKPMGSAESISSAVVNEPRFVRNARNKQTFVRKFFSSQDHRRRCLPRTSTSLATLSLT
jgi:hypothetical protein